MENWRSGRLGSNGNERSEERRSGWVSQAPEHVSTSSRSREHESNERGRQHQPPTLHTSQPYLPSHYRGQHYEYERPAPLQAFAVTPHHAPEPLTLERPMETSATARAPSARAEPEKKERSMVTAPYDGQPVVNVTLEGRPATIHERGASPTYTTTRPYTTGIVNPASQPLTTSQSADNRPSQSRLPPLSVPIVAPRAPPLPRDSLATLSRTPALPQSSARTHSVSVSSSAKVMPLDSSRHEARGSSARQFSSNEARREERARASEERAPSNSQVASGAMNGAAEAGNSGEDPPIRDPRQLRVEDALAYLEEVKNFYGEQPYVYNSFLDIMKDFKSKSINTHDVICRVSQLFRGNQKLILGFNAFLPPGHRIELRENETNGGTVSGYVAPGINFTRISGQDRLPPPTAETSSVKKENVRDTKEEYRLVTAPAPYEQRPRQLYAVPPDGVPHRIGPLYERDSATQHYQQSQRADGSGSRRPVPREGQNRAESLNGTSVAPSRGFVAKSEPALTNKPNEAAGDTGRSKKRPQKTMDFNKAVTYVNRIKDRFSHDPSVYKTFLEVLQTYQQDQNPISEVWERVKNLFRGHEDLMDEFHNFLPEASREGNQNLAPLGLVPNPFVAQQVHAAGQGRQPYVPVPHDYRASSVAIAERPRSPPRTLPVGDSGNAVPRSAKPSAPRKGPAAGAKRRSRQPPAVVDDQGDNVSATSAELEFFVELRHILELYGLHSYAEIMKCVMLFTQEILSAEELIKMFDELLPPMSARKALLSVFQSFVYQPSPAALPKAIQQLRIIKEKELRSLSVGRSPVSNGVAPRQRPSDTNKKVRGNPWYNGKRLGDVSAKFGTVVDDSTSYVKIPDDYGNVVCSGMTSADKSVLNHSIVNKGRYGDGMLSSVRQKEAKDQDVAVLEIDAKMEEKLMDVEDGRYRLDVAISSAEQALELLRPYVEASCTDPLDLGAMQAQAIEMIYGDMSVDVVEILRKHPEHAAKPVFDRIEAKIESLKTLKGYMEKVWKTSRFRNVSSSDDMPKTWSKVELLKDVASTQDRVKCSLFKSESNQKYVMDLFWYVLEWETDSLENASAASDLFRKVFTLLESDGGTFFADKHLYALTRLACAVSERAEYVLLHNYDGTAYSEFTKALKNVLGGQITIVEYENVCRRLYGAGRSWESLLADFPMVLGRLVRSCLRFESVEVAKQFLDLYETQKSSEGSASIAGYRQAALDLARVNGHFLVEIKGRADNEEMKTKYRYENEEERERKSENGDNLMEEVKEEAKSENDEMEIDTHNNEQEKDNKEMDVEKSGKEERSESGKDRKAKDEKTEKLEKTGDERESVTLKHAWTELTIRRVPQSRMTKFVQCNADDTNAKDDVVKTKFIAFVEKKAKNSNRKKEDVVMIDGLKPRYEDESKRLYFVSGTESSLYRKRRGGIKRRRKAGKAKSLEKFEKWLETKVSTGNGGQPVAL